MSFVCVVIMFVCFQMARANPFLGLAAIAVAVAAPGQDPVSQQTVSRRMESAGLKTRVVSSQIELTPAHKAQRLLFAQQQLETVRQEDWMAVKFSDEKTFRSDMSGKTYVRR